MPFFHGWLGGFIARRTLEVDFSGELTNNSAEDAAEFEKLADAKLGLPRGLGLEGHWVGPVGWLDKGPCFFWLGGW